MLGTTLGVLAGGAVHAPAVAAEGHRNGCDPQYSKTTTKGQTVWVPSSRSAGPFQWGGSQSLSASDGELSATSKGSADTVGGSAGIKFGIGEASAKYDRQWNRSTTTSKSVTQTFTTHSGEVSRKVHWRWRLYMRGYMFTAVKTKHIPTPCIDAGTWKRKMRVVVPTKAKLFSFSLERYKYRNQIKNSAGQPINP
ncbi:hypothetical protein [Nocardioides sp.]|uniref:hypothetical protein n=1 Tax=Nocardioides sp. TaxID=35761 RepID=UPI0035649255